MHGHAWNQQTGPVANEGALNKSNLTVDSLPFALPTLSFSTTGRLQDVADNGLGTRKGAKTRRCRFGSPNLTSLLLWSVFSKKRTSKITIVVRSKRGLEEGFLVSPFLSVVLGQGPYLFRTLYVLR